MRWPGHSRLPGRLPQGKHTHAPETLPVPLLWETSEMLQLGAADFRKHQPPWKEQQTWGGFRGHHIYPAFCFRRRQLLQVIFDAVSLPVLQYFSSLLYSGFQFFSCTPRWNSSVALLRSAVYGFQKWFTGEAFTASISQASVPSWSVRGSMTQLTAKKASSFK